MYHKIDINAWQTKMVVYIAVLHYPAVAEKPVIAERQLNTCYRV